MQTAAILMVIAAVGGAVLASFRLRGQPYPPLWMALGHGAFAAVGLGLLIYHAVTATAPLPMMIQVALGLFALAALGGATMLLGFHMQSKALPIPLVLGHGLLALAGVITLLLGVYRP